MATGGGVGSRRWRPAVVGRPPPPQLAAAAASTAVFAVVGKARLSASTGVEGQHRPQVCAAAAPLAVAVGGLPN